MCDARCEGVIYCSNKILGFSKDSIPSRKPCKCFNFIHGYISLIHPNKFYLVSNLGKTGSIKFPNEES